MGEALADMTTPVGVAEAAGTSPGVAVEFRGIEKRFGETIALRGVSLDLLPGKVHAFVGENGAGKSTMLGVATGRVAPSRGEVKIFGERLRPNNPRHARHLGVAAIYQELTIVPAMSACENVFLGAMPSKRGFVGAAAAREQYAELGRRVGLTVSPDVVAGSLSVSQQQLLEIMRAMVLDARVVLFDEPTSSLPEQEREAFFEVVAELKRDGCAVVLISHNLDEVAANADEVSVFRDGSMVAQKPAHEWTKAALVKAMVGSEKAEQIEYFFDGGAPPKLTSEGDAEVVMSAAVELAGREAPIPLTVRRGEILGIAGLVGSGRTSLLRALAGLDSRAKGWVVLGSNRGKLPKNPREALRRGLALIPEDRKRDGLALQLRAADNIVLSDLKQVKSHGLISERKLVARAAEISGDIGFDPARVREIARGLSGGNQQKLLIGRWRHAPPKILLADEPTRGVDIGAKAEILSTLREFAAAGGAVLMVSSELEEVLAVSDRVIVLRNGQLVAEIQRGPEYTVHSVLNAIFQAHPD